MTTETAEHKTPAVSFLPRSNDVLYRAATANDVPVIACVIATAFEEHRGKLDPPSSSLNKTPESVALELQSATAIVATFYDALLGCVFYSAREDYIYLAHLAVLPDYRGLGIARTLIARVEDAALSLGSNRLRLSVRVSMEKTRSFYESLNFAFHSYGTHTGYQQPTYVNMEKTLATPSTQVAEP